MRKYLFCLFRILFGIGLMIIGLRTLTEVQNKGSFVTTSIDRIQTLISGRGLNIAFVKDHAQSIISAEAGLIIASGLLVLGGFGLSKLTFFLAMLIEVGLVHNIYFYDNPVYKFYNVAFVSLFGAIINLS